MNTIKRNIVQITATDNKLYALCDDGSLWTRSEITDNWCELIGVPNRVQTTLEKWTKE